MPKKNILPKLASLAVAFGICFHPSTANAFSLTFNAPGSTSLTIGDKAGRGGDSRDTSSYKNEIIFDQTLTTSNGNIRVSGTFRGSYITYSRSLDNSNVGLTTDGTKAIILTLTNFQLANNTNSTIDLTNFLSARALVSDFIADPNLIANESVNYYLSYAGGYQSSVGSSDASGDYNNDNGTISGNLVTLPGTPQSGNNFSSFTSITQQIPYYESGIAVTNTSLKLDRVFLAAGASLVLPNSLVTLAAIDDNNGNPLTQDQVEQLSYLAGLELRNSQSGEVESVPEPSSLLGLLALGGLFSVGSRKVNKAKKA